MNTNKDLRAQLPELPEPQAMDWQGFAYTAEQMQDYAIAALARQEEGREAVAWRVPTPYGVGYNFASEAVMKDMSDWLNPAPPSAGEGGACAACKGAGEVEVLTAHASGDPQDSFMAPATCPVCDGDGDADQWRLAENILPMSPGWYIGRTDGRIEPLRFDGKYWHHTRMTRDLANPSHWRTFDSLATPTPQSGEAGVERGLPTLRDA